MKLPIAQEIRISAQSRISRKVGWQEEAKEAKPYRHEMLEAVNDGEDGQRRLLLLSTTKRERGTCA